MLTTSHPETGESLGGTDEEPDPRQFYYIELENIKRRVLGDTVELIAPVEKKSEGLTYLRHRLNLLSELIVFHTKGKISTEDFLALYRKDNWDIISEQRDKFLSL